MLKWKACRAEAIQSISLFLIGKQRGEDVDPLLIRPVCNLFCFWSKKYKALCWCGVQHEQKTEQVSRCMSFLKQVLA